MPEPVREALRKRLRGCAAVAQMMGHDLSPRAVSLLREEMVESFFGALASTEPQRVVRQPPVSNARILRRVEDYLAEHSHAAPHLLELCQAVGVSRRTLHRAFNDLLGVAPKAYLRLKSLSAARAALQQAVESGASVTQIALDHGFFELGRFAVAYRRMFGESPSQTARKPAPTNVPDPATANWRSILIEGLPEARRQALLG
jgi:AraC family ethanolamine operon transcriptional activator